MPKMPKMPAAVSIVNWTLLVGGLLNLAAGTWRMLIGDATLGAAGLTAGLVLLLAATIERFELVKGLGVEAKTRLLTAKIDEAEVILAQMKRLAEMSSETLILLAARAGRIGGATPPEEAHRLSRTVKQVLEAAGSPPDAIRNVLTPWACYAARDIAVDALQLYQRRVQETANSLQGKVNAFKKPIAATDLEGFNAAVADRQRMSTYAGTLLDGVMEWPLIEYPKRLRAIADQAPAFVPTETVEAFRAEVESWAGEFDHLARELDYANPQRWFAQINEIRTGRHRH